jgi:hypothetical protein
VPGHRSRGRCRRLDEGVYLASVSTMYRLLREAEQVRERRAQAAHPARTKPELIADAPNQVWSWDITKLAGRPANGPANPGPACTDGRARLLPRPPR